MNIDEFNNLKPYDDVIIANGILKGQTGYVLYVYYNKTPSDLIPIVIPGHTKLGRYQLYGKKGINKIQE